MEFRVSIGKAMDMNRALMENSQSFLSLLQNSPPGKGTCEISSYLSRHVKRKYSADMRQKATFREKNRIKAIGKEFKDLAKLLPQTGGGKRSHQKILQDSVAYIRAMEVELSIIDEKKLLQSWSVKRGENNRTNCGDFHAFNNQKKKSANDMGKLLLNFPSGSDSEEENRNFAYTNYYNNNSHLMSDEKSCFDSVVSGFHCKP